MLVDLREDAKRINELLAKAVAKFGAAATNAPATIRPERWAVSGIELTYGYMEAARVDVNFDTRAVYEPDGTWTHAEYASLNLPNWEAAFSALDNEPLSFVQFDGSRVDVPDGVDDAEYAAILDRLLKDVLIDARNHGLFDLLLKREKCELSVESFEGMYGWPDYKDRGKDNLVT